MNRRNSCISLVGTILVSLLLCGPVGAQEPATRKFKPGDEVLCFHQIADQLILARVLSVSGSDVELEYEYDGEKHVEKIGRDMLMFAWEKRAISKVRTWQDPAGQFKVQAAAVGLDTDKGEILLHRIDTDVEVNVQVNKLSQADQEFIAKLVEEMKRGGPKLSEPEDFELLPVPNGLVWAILQTYSHETQQESIENRPNNNPRTPNVPFRETEEGKSQLDAIRPFDPEVPGSSWPESMDWLIDVKHDLTDVPSESGVTPLVPPEVRFQMPNSMEIGQLGYLHYFGGDRQWFLTTRYAADDGVHDLVWISAKDNLVRSQAWLPGGMSITGQEAESIIDVDPANQQVLTANTRDGKAFLNVWKFDPEAQSAKSVCRWESRIGARAKKIHGYHSEARLVSESLVLHRWDVNSWILWDFIRKKEVWHINGHSLNFDVSPGGRYFALTSYGKVRIIEIATGKTLAYLPLGMVPVYVKFDPTGRYLAVTTNQTVFIWELGQSQPAACYSSYPDAITTFKNESALDIRSVECAWVGQDYLFLASRSGYHLLDLKTGLIPWKIEQPNTFGFSAAKWISDKLCYFSVPAENRKAAPTLISVAVPTPAMLEEFNAIDPSTFEEQFATKPGTSVRIEVSGTAAVEKLREKLIEIAAQANWTIDPNSSITLSGEWNLATDMRVKYQMNETGDDILIDCKYLPPNLNSKELTIEVLEGKNTLWRASAASSLPLSLGHISTFDEKNFNKIVAAEIDDVIAFAEITQVPTMIFKVPESYIQKREFRDNGTLEFEFRGLVPKVPKVKASPSPSSGN